MPNNIPSQIVNLYSGQIQFADPTKPWTPDDFPTLPSTNLILTAIGTADNANISTLSFTNTILYEPYEPVSVYPSVRKSVLVDQSGIVQYSEPRIGFLSTIAPAFTKGYDLPADVVSFTPSSTGGAGILDILTGRADTLTNAIGKLDAWIANAFLLQPPAVHAVEPETTSLYGGMRWLNFNTYSILDKFIPYVTNILFIIGDPTTPNYCTFEVNDSEYFPYKTYCDGISPVNHPLVRLRIYTDCFLTAADVLYSKQVMQTRCIKIITESGNVRFPETGKVFAIENTNGTNTYTTVSIFLPNLTASYPKNTAIPVYIAYLNKTDSAINITQTSTIIHSVGDPSMPQKVTPIGATQSTITFELVKPLYADSLGNVTEPLFSSYQMDYTLQQMNTAFDVTTGFQYGIPNPTSLRTELSAYNNTIFTQSFPYIQSTQQVVLTGTHAAPLIPGVVWSTTTSAVNCASHEGPAVNSQWMSTLFPLQTTHAIRSVPLVNINESGSLAAAHISSITYASYTDGWNVGPYVSTDVLFFSVSTPLLCNMSTFAQFNDASLPGDRSTITVAMAYTNVDAHTLVTSQLVASTCMDDFPLHMLLDSEAPNAAFIMEIEDSQTNPTSQHYFYKYRMQGEQIISTISTANQTLQFVIQNHTNNGTVLEAQTMSSLAYVFQTDQDSPFSTLDVTFNGRITSTGQVSGLYTASQSSQLYFDMVGINFANVFTASTLAHAQIGYIEQYTSTIVHVGPRQNYTQNVHIWSDMNEVTELPFPQNTPLTMSSLRVGLYPTVYTNPISTPTMFLAGAFVAASPLQTQSTFLSTFGSSVFIDTVSLSTVSSFTNTMGLYGQRVSNLLPRLEHLCFAYDMGDSISETGDSGPGLDVSLNTLYTMNDANVFTISPSVFYNNALTISTIYMDTSSRELLYTKGHYTHPAGYNFSQFSGDSIGVPNAVYPDFTNDLVDDVNDGYRYASFAYETPIMVEPTPYQFINVCIINPSGIGAIGFVKNANTFFPCAPVDPYAAPYMNVRLHAKYYGAYDAGTYQTVESEWINGLKERDPMIFDDQLFDIGGSYFASTIGNDIVYSIQMNRRFYTKVGYIVRVGISRQGSYSGSGAHEITFDGIRTWLSDDVAQTQTDISADMY